MESRRLVAYGLAVLPNGIKHHPKNGYKNDTARNQHEPVQIGLRLGNLGNSGMQIELILGWASGQIFDGMRQREGCAAHPNAGQRQQGGHFIENALDHVHFLIASD